MRDFSLKLVTPNGEIFQGEVRFCSAPGVEGSLGILAGHAPIAAVLTKGIVKLTGEGWEKYFAVDTGILEVAGSGHVLILADHALEAKTQEDAANLVPHVGKSADPIVRLTELLP